MKNLLIATILDTALCVLLYFEQDYALISWVIIGALLRAYIYKYVPGIIEWADGLEREDFIWYVERGMALELYYRLFVLFLLIAGIALEFYVFYKILT